MIFLIFLIVSSSSSSSLLEDEWIMRFKSSFSDSSNVIFINCNNAALQWISIIVIFTKSITGYVNCVHRWSETKWLSARFEYTNESDRSLESWILWALWAWIGPQPIYRGNHNGCANILPWEMSYNCNPKCSVDDSYLSQLNVRVWCIVKF